jgi:hypothetical protein
MAKMKVGRARAVALARYVITRDTAVCEVDAAVASILLATNLLGRVANPERKSLLAKSLALRRSVRTLLTREKEVAHAAIRIPGRRMKLTKLAQTMVVKKVLKDQYLDVIDMKKLVKEKFPFIVGIDTLSDSTLYRLMQANRITEKKTHKRDRKTDPKKLSDFWLRMYTVPTLEVVSYDEAHVHNKMTRNRGWSKAGTKAFSNPTHQRKSERYTLMLAVSHQKVVAW